MKKVLLPTMLMLFIFGCNVNPSKEERIQNLESELKKSSHEIDELRKRIEFRQDSKTNLKTNNMNLGAFSVSLSVKDLKKSRGFYKKLGFEKIGGDLEKNYLIMKNDHAVIGLFQGMFEDNILTFNPGWDENGKETATYVDIRDIQQELKSQEINVGPDIDKATEGPASFMITDPDGNVILIDQHR